MKKYRSHKVVEAAPILGYDNAGTSPKSHGVYVGPCHLWTPVPADFFARGTPSLGDYLVRYQPDGYLSWSPKAVFEAGYAEMED